MKTSITWEQKARISALRAACASFFPREPNASDTDEERAERILDRAETFHSWLTLGEEGRAFTLRKLDPAGAVRDYFAHLSQADVDDYHESENDAIRLGTE